MKDVWDRMIKEANQNFDYKHLELDALNEEIEQYLQRAVKSSSDTVRDRYELEIEKLEKNRKILELKLKEQLPINYDFGTACETVKEFVENPLKIWRKKNYNIKVLVPQLVFKEDLTFDKKEGFGTVTLSSPFKLFDDVNRGNLRLVEMFRINLNFQIFITLF